MFKGFCSGFVVWAALITLGISVAFGHLLVFLITGAVLGFLLD